MSRSRFRGSPTRSPFRSPARLYETERDAILEDQIRFKSALRAESDARRINDELSLLQTKVRTIPELQSRVQTLLRQNSQLARDNDQLARELNQRRYEVQRLRIATSEQHDRDSIKNGQLYETTKALELQLELQKKERLEGNRLYQTHIQKLQRMLDDKVQELDISTIKCSDLSKELEITIIKFEEEKNKLKNIMARTEHELQRELEYTKEKNTTQKFSEIDAMKRNHAAQVVILEDQISKLKNLNAAKTDEFQVQLADNRNLRKRHDEEIRALGAQNDELRGRMLKLQEINRSQVENIQTKYNDYHHQGTSNLKEQHGREIKLLLDEIDKNKWLLHEKNNQINNLVHDKRELRKNLDEVTLQLSAEIDSLKNKLYSQKEKHDQNSKELNARINDLCDKALRDSEAYHERAKDFRSKISSLEAEIADKQSMMDKNRREAEMREKDLLKNLNLANSTIEKLKRDLDDSEQERKGAEERHQQYKRKAEGQISKISRELNEACVKLEETQDKLTRQTENNNGNEQILKVEIESLRKTIAVLDENIQNQKRRHSSQMQELSSNINEKVKRLQAAQRKALDDLQKSRQEQIKQLQLRVEKSNRDKEYAENQLKRYIEMYNNLEKYFKQPHDGALFDEKSKDSIYQVLNKVVKSSIHIF